MLSPVCTSLGKKQSIDKVLKQTTDEAAISSGLRCKPIPSKPPRRKNQQQQLPPRQEPLIVYSTASPTVHPKATMTTTTTPMSQDNMIIMKKERKEREHSDDEYAEQIITKAFQFLTRPKRSRDMTASEVLEYYLARRQRAQLDQQSAVDHALDVDTSGSSVNSTLPYYNSLDTTGLARMDESKTGVSGQLLAAEEYQQQLTLETPAQEGFCNFRLYPVLVRPMAPGTFVASISKDQHKKLTNNKETISLDRSVRKSKEDDPMYGQQPICEPIVMPTQPQRSATSPIVTSTTTGCEREQRWRNIWRKLKRIFAQHRSRRQKKQPIVDEQSLTDQLATNSTTHSNNNLDERPGLKTGLGSRFDSHRQSMKKRPKRRDNAARHCKAI